MRKKSTLLIGGAIILLLLLLGLSAVRQHSKQNAPVKISTQLVTEVLANDSKSSYALFSDDGKQNVSQDDWTTLVTKLNSFFKGQSPQLSQKDVSSSIAVVKYSIKGSDGTYIMTVTLEPVGHTWGVQSFTSALRS